MLRDAAGHDVSGDLDSSDAFLKLNEKTHL